MPNQQDPNKPRDNSLGLDPADIAILSTTDQLKQAIPDVLDARSAYSKTTNEIAKGQVALTREAVDNQTQTSAEEGALLAEIEKAFNRKAEIDNSFLLQAMEPFVGPFNDQYSREALTKQVVADNMRLKIVDEKHQLKAKDLAVKSEHLQAQLDAAKAGLDSKLGPIKDLQTLLDVQKTAKLTSDDVKQSLLTSTDGKDLSKLVGVMGITQRDVEHQQNVIASERYVTQNSAYTSELNNMRVREARLGQMSIQQLNDPKLLNAYSAYEIQHAKQGRMLQELSFTAQLTPAYLKGATTQELIDLRQQAQQKGGVAEVSKAGTTLKLSVDDINKELNLKLQEQSDVASANTVGSITDVALNRAMDTALLSVGGSTDPNASTEAKLDALTKNDNLTTAETEMTENARAKFVAANKMQNPEIATKLRQQATELVKQFNEEQIKKRTLGKSQEMAGALTRDLLQGRVDTTDDAMTLITNAMSTHTNSLFGDTTNTGLPAYDAALSNLNGTIASTLNVQTSDKTGVDKTQSLFQALVKKNMTPSEIMAQSLSDRHEQEVIARPIISEMLTEAHAQTAAALGDKTLAYMIRHDTRTLFPDGVFDERGILQYIKDGRSNIKLPDYLNKLRELSGQAARSVTAPAGENGSVVAALNKIIFNNNPGAYGEQYVQDGVNAALQAIQNPKPDSAFLATTQALGNSQGQ